MIRLLRLTLGQRLAAQPIAHIHELRAGGLSGRLVTRHVADVADLSWRNLKIAYRRQQHTGLWLASGQIVRHFVVERVSNSIPF
jgi:hypothetical protein